MLLLPISYAEFLSLVQQSVNGYDLKDLVFSLLLSASFHLGNLAQGFLAVLPPGGVNIPLQDTVLVVLEAIGVNLLYAFGRRRFTDIEKQRRYNAEMKAFREEMGAATKAGDKAKVDKLKKKQQQMQKMQAEMMKDNFKPTLLFALPLLGVYYLVNFFINGAILAVSPITIPLVIYTLPIQLNFFWWYMICSFTFQGIISRLFGLTLD